MAVLHYGTESFRLPADTNVPKLLGRLTWAAPGTRMIPVGVEGGTVHVAVGAGVAIWVDERPLSG